MEAGKSPVDAEICAPWPVFIHCRNAAAAAWFLLAASTASALPPFSELAAVPAVHCGIGATRQSPLARRHAALQVDAHPAAGHQARDRPVGQAGVPLVAPRARSARAGRR